MSEARAAAVAAACADPVPPQTVRLLRLGQAGVVLRWSDTTVLVDPWLATPPERRVPSVPAWSIVRCDLVLLTHAHDDHADPDAIAALTAAHPACRFVAPAVLGGALEEAGVPAGRRWLVGPGDRVVTGAAPVHVTAVAAHAPDVALLPVNGRDAMRERAGLVGNLDAAEAAALADAIGARLLVPIHHDGFAGNPGDPADVVRAAERLAPALGVVVLPAHVPITLGNA